jgi:hypothetical protein
VTYSELSREIEQLNYRDKFRLAQLLIQLARKGREPKIRLTKSQEVLAKACARKVSCGVDCLITLTALSLQTSRKTKEHDH